MKHVFEIRRELIDRTLDGSLGNYPPDVVRKYVTGLPEYFVDGMPVTESEFKEMLDAENQQRREN